MVYSYRTWEQHRPKPDLRVTRHWFMDGKLDVRAGLNEGEVAPGGSPRRDGA
jgi:hypothetical protein